MSSYVLVMRRGNTIISKNKWGKTF
jgi:hypothetical protein